MINLRKRHDLYASFAGVKYHIKGNTTASVVASVMLVATDASISVKASRVKAAIVIHFEALKRLARSWVTESSDPP